MNSVTVRDVAKAAGVSASTVSRALSSNRLVASATREKIIDTARQLGYSPNQAARGLITGRTNSIGLVIPDLENPYFAAVTKGVQARAVSAGYSVFVADSDEDRRTEVNLVRKLAKQVDGIILCSPRMSEADIAAASSETTMVLVNRRWSQIPSIVIDDGEIIRQALEHLHALGHRHVAYAGGPLDSWSDKQRRIGIHTVTPKLPGLTVTEIGAFSPTFDGGQPATDLAIASGATAILAYNDLMALGVMARLHRRGIAVPDDISIIGIDGVSVGTLVTPSLTSVRAPLKAVGRSAVNTLIDLVDGTAHANTFNSQSVQLIVRNSTSVPPVRPSESPPTGT